MKHALCRQEFDTIEDFNRHVGTPVRCPVLEERNLRRMPHLDCGCEPGWRCIPHAKAAKAGRPNPKAEAIVNLVFSSDFPDKTRGVDTATGTPGITSRNPRSDATKSTLFRTQTAPRGRPRKWATEAQRKRAERRRKAGE